MDDGPPLVGNTPPATTCTVPGDVPLYTQLGPKPGCRNTTACATAAAWPERPAWASPCGVWLGEPLRGRGTRPVRQRVLRRCSQSNGATVEALLDGWNDDIDVANAEPRCRSTASGEDDLHARRGRDHAVVDGQRAEHRPRRRDGGCTLQLPDDARRRRSAIRLIVAALQTGGLRSSASASMFGGDGHYPDREGPRQPANSCSKWAGAATATAGTTPPRGSPA